MLVQMPVILEECDYYQRFFFICLHLDELKCYQYLNGKIHLKMIIKLIN